MGWLLNYVIFKHAKLKRGGLVKQYSGISLYEPRISRNTSVRVEVLSPLAYWKSEGLLV
jgi:hypothetical protein